MSSLVHQSILSKMTAKLKKKSNDFLIIEWTINNCYTSFQNTKNIKLNDLVVCQLNDINDAGRVIFVGTESECVEKLDQLKASYKQRYMLQNDGKPKKSEQTIKKEPKKLLPKTGSNNSIFSHFRSKSTISKNEYLSKSTTTLMAENINNQIIPMNTLRQRVSSESKLDSFSNLNLGFKSDLSLSLPDTHCADLSEKNCENCKCCTILEKKIDSFKAQLNWYESFFKMTPEVRTWLDQIKPNIIEFPNEINFKSSEILGERLFSHSFSGGLNTSEQSLKNTEVPEIRIESSESF